MRCSWWKFSSLTFCSAMKLTQNWSLMSWNSSLVSQLTWAKVTMSVLNRESCKKN
jgi:hypothetical protein